jgi:hypothetical protein
MRYKTSIAATRFIIFIKDILVSFINLESIVNEIVINLYHYLEKLTLATFL